jgi:CHAT domain-containing protein/Flp pilus assembly protein TadD
LGPDGRQLLESDGPGGAQSIETAALAAETAGIYRLIVVAHDKDAPLGRYKIAAAQPREATRQDLDQAAAQRQLEQGTRLIAQGAKEKLEEALKHLAEAQTLFHRSGDAASEGSALNFMGIISLMRGESRNAVDYLNQAWELQRQTDDLPQNRQAKAALLGNLAVAHAQLGQFAQAVERLKQALPLMQAAQNKGGEAKLLVSLGSVHQNLGRFQQALDYYEQALKVFRELGDKGSEGVTLNNAGTLYRFLGDPGHALETYQQALPLLRSAGDKRVEAIALDNLGVLDRSTDPRKALEEFNQALALRRSIGDKRGEGVTLDNLGVAHRLAGDAKTAIQFHTEALRLLQAVEDVHRSALALDNLGVAERELGNLTQAETRHRQALQMLQSVGDRLAEAAVWKNIAWVEREQGRLTEARVAVEHAIALSEFLRANVHSQETRASFLATVAEYYEFDTDLLMRMHEAEPRSGHDAEALTISEQGRARSLLELLNEAGGDLRQGVSAASIERERMLKNQLISKLDNLTRILNTKASTEQKNLAKKEINDLTEEYRQAQAEIRRSSPHYATLTQPQPLSAQEIQRQTVDEQTLLLEYALGEKRSYLWVVSPSSIRSYALPPREQIETAAKKVYDLLTARQSNQLQIVKQAEKDYPALASDLSRMLLGPAAGQLSDKRLVIVASGALGYLPFAALPEPGDESAAPAPLLVKHEIIALPSASSLAVIRRELAGRARAPETAAVFADPVFSSDDPRIAAIAGSRKSVEAHPQSVNSVHPPGRSSGHRMRDFNTIAGSKFARLPFSRNEADALLSLAPGQANLKALNFEASRAAVLNTDLSRYRIVHFAAHGVLDSQNPHLSGLVLSLVDQQGKPQDGFLRLLDIYDLKLGADLVTLSACQTALGKQVRGEGIIGLTRGFMYAGAPRIVASLWQVNDAATAQLMKQFYRGLIKDGLRPAAALRAAQLELLKQKRWSAPFYWAPFVLQGEWR